MNAKKLTKHLPLGWFIEGDHLHDPDGYSRCVRFDAGLERARVAQCLSNHGHDDFAALWEPNAAHLVEVLKSISALAEQGDSDICQDIRRRSDAAIAFAQ